jgi:hypothetical protein
MTSKREAAIVETTRNIAEQIVDLAHLASGGSGNVDLTRLFLMEKLLEETRVAMERREENRRRRA